MITNIHSESMKKIDMSIYCVIAFGYLVYNNFGIFFVYFLDLLTQIIARNQTYVRINSTLQYFPERA